MDGHDNTRGEESGGASSSAPRCRTHCVDAQILTAAQVRPDQTAASDFKGLYAPNHEHLPVPCQCSQDSITSVAFLSPSEDLDHVRARALL